MESLIIEKYRDLLEICDSLIVINKSEGVLYVSPSSSGIFGINKTELEGKKLVDLFENSEIISKAISSRDYYVPIALKAKNLSTDESTDIIIILQLFDRTPFKLLNKSLGFILIASKIPEDKVRGGLGIVLVFSKEVVKIFNGFHATLSRSFGGGRFGAIMSSLLLLSLLGLGTTYALVRENSHLIQDIQQTKQNKK